MMRLTVWVLVVGAFACSSKPKAPAGAMVSLPKSDWPCARRETTTVKQETGDRQSTSITRFEYGKATSCLLPLELVSEGLVGCAISIDVFRPNKASYDGAHLIALDMFTVDWSGDVVHELGHKATASGDQIECHRADGSLHWKLDLDGSGRPRHMDNPHSTPITIDYAWDGSRLATVEYNIDPVRTRYEMIYDCSKL
jgi:hypothetical protein